MGYTTDFTGNLNFDKPLTTEQVKYINDFSDSRRMKRDNDILQRLYKGKHGLNGSYGVEGEYFALPGDDMGQANDDSILDYNIPPGQLSYNDPNHSYEENSRRIESGECQPGLWCQWTVNEEGTELAWNGSEKFYHYIEWLQYLINHFFKPWGHVLNGTITWEGEDSNDKGMIIVESNVVTTKIGRTVYE